jgi:hypothetical protein
MDQLHPSVSGAGASNVIPFRPASNTGACLSLRDRMDVMAWRDPANTLGFDRLVIHERSSCDPPDLDSFLGIYRRGEVWASWNLARCGAGVLAWCSRSGADVGRFASVADALEALLSDTRAIA